MRSDRFCRNAPDVIAEIIDGEAILINLANGCYYGTDEVGGDIWSLLEQGASLAEVAAALTSRYDGEPAEIESAVTAFAEALRQESLLLPRAEAENAINPSAGVREPRPRFTPPRLEKHDDMQELLLADPIHDVGDTGWPSRRFTP